MKKNWIQMKEKIVLKLKNESKNKIEFNSIFFFKFSIE